MALKKQFSFPNTIIIAEGVARFERFILVRERINEPIVEINIYASDTAMAADAEPVGRDTLVMTGFNPSDIRGQIQAWLLTQPEYAGATIVNGVLRKAFTLPSTVVLGNGVVRVERFIINRGQASQPLVELALYATEAAMDAGADPVSRTHLIMSGFNPTLTRNQVYAWALTQARYSGAVEVND